MKLFGDGVAAVKKAAAAFVSGVVPAKRHRCDPDGFSCDCARKAAIGGRERWLGPRRGGWLR